MFRRGPISFPTVNALSNPKAMWVDKRIPEAVTTLIFNLVLNIIIVSHFVEYLVTDLRALERVRNPLSLRLNVTLLFDLPTHFKPDAKIFRKIDQFANSLLIGIIEPL